MYDLTAHFDRIRVQLLLPALVIDSCAQVFLDYLAVVAVVGNYNVEVRYRAVHSVRSGLQSID